MPADQGDLADPPEVVGDRQHWLRLVRNRKARERYGPAHRRRRHHYEQRLARGEILTCFRCGGEIDSDSDWELDHDDWDPSQSFPSHRSCNRAAPNRVTTSRMW